jgi:hypothetical protein
MMTGREARTIKVNDQDAFKAMIRETTNVMTN